MRIAFTTFAVLKKPYGHPEVQEFDDRTPAVFLEAERAPGFIARAKDVGSSELSNFNRDWGEWGRFSVPRFYTLGRDNDTDQRGSTLSLWEDLHSVFAFAYSGLHKEALRKRTEWFLEPSWPTYAIWWVEDTHTPQWREACEKLEMLHDLGPTAQAFNFKVCFDERGNSVRVKALR